MATVRELVTKILFKTDKNSLKQAEKSINKLKNTLESVGKTAKTSGDATATTLRNVVNAGQQAGSAIKTSMEQARLSIEGVKQSALQTSSALNTVRGSASQVKVNPAQAGNRNPQPKQKSKMTGADIATAGATAMVAGTAITAPLVNAVDDAKDFEYAMKRVQSVTNATNEDLAKLDEQARMLGRATEFNAKQVADAQYYLGVAGWKTNQILAVTPSLLQLSIAGGTDLARVADIISDDMTAMGIAIDKDGKSAKRFADIFASTMTNSNTNLEMMGETMKYAGSVAGTFGYRMEDVALAIGLMANSGIKASEAGTALRSIMTRLATQPKEVAGAIAKVGAETGIVISPIDEATGKVKSLRDVFVDLRKALKGYNEVERVALGKQFAGMYGTAGFNAIINASDEDFTKLMGAIENCDGASERMANTMQDNLRGSLIATQSAMYDLNVEVGKSMTPALRNATGGLTGMLNGVTDLAKEFPRLTSSVSLFGGILGGLLVGLGAIGIAVGGVITLAGAFGVTVSAPIVAGVLAVVAVVSALIANFDLVKTKINEVGVYAKKPLSVIKGLIDAILNPLDTLCSLLDRAKTGFANLIANAESGALQRYNSIVQNQNNTFNLSNKDELQPAMASTNEFFPDD